MLRISVVLYKSFVAYSISHLNCKVKLLWSSFLKLANACQTISMHNDYANIVC